MLNRFDFLRLHQDFLEKNCSLNKDGFFCLNNGGIKSIRREGLIAIQSAFFF